MRFLFECDDEVCLPILYSLIDDVKPLVDTIKQINVDENKVNKVGNKKVFKMILEKLTVKSPKETSKVLKKFWVLEDGEKAPNIFKTIPALLNSEEAVDFFTSALPSLLQISKEVSPLLN